MGSFVSKDGDLPDELSQDLMFETGFSKTQINRLYIRYQHLDTDNKGYLLTHDLLKLPEVRLTIYRRSQYYKSTLLHEYVLKRFSPPFLKECR